MKHCKKNVPVIKYFSTTIFAVTGWQTQVIAQMERITTPTMMQGPCFMMTMIQHKQIQNLPESHKCPGRGKGLQKKLP